MDRNLKTLKELLSFSFCLLFSISCTPKQANNSSILLHLPSSPTSSMKKSLSVARNSAMNVESIWGLSQPTTNNDINCYGVLVSGAEDVMNTYKCYDNSGTAVMSVGVYLFAAPSGATISLAAPEGKNRTITILGMSASNSACSNINSNGIDYQKLSEPLVIGSATADLVGGQTTEVTVSVSATNASSINHCDFMPAGSSSNPIPAPAVQSIKVGATGASCAIWSDGELQCWGANSSFNMGQLGQGTSVDTSIPAITDPGISYAMVAAPNSITCGITTTGILKCWGGKNTGGVGDGTTSTYLSPVVIDSGTTYSSVASGGTTTCAITTSSDLKCWGSNSNGSVGNGTTVAQLMPIIIDAGTTYASVSPGVSSTCGITTGGVLKCWGGNSNGQLGIGNTTQMLTPTVVDSGTSYSKVSVGTNVACAITAAGDLKCWGANSSGQVGNGTISDQLVPVVIDSGISYKDVSTYRGTTFGLTSSGVIKGWGSNSNYTFGNGTASTSNVPIILDGGMTYSSFTIGYDSFLGITTSSNIRAWGYGQNYELLMPPGIYQTPVSVTISH